ncbi:Ca-activated chloride channel family protein [Cytobacillus oceanisediminis]|uniref:Ca-activated chloride channel family protein n=1 Tax=Cytobacillus oceanisediminis TaxID=665099 RepID=A0A2V2ZHL2_9BACI|nr:Ca-activated chloride channel family protein [Cytobacillus oceanisediminis]
MLRNIQRFAFLLLCLLIIAGCSSTSNEGTNSEDSIKDKKNSGKAEQVEEVADSKKAEQIEIDAPKLPINLEEIIAYPTGQFASNEFKIEDEEVQSALDSLPAFPEDASDAELQMLFEHLYSLYKKEYQDPKEMFTSSTVSEPDQNEAIVEKIETVNVEIILDSSGSMANLMGSKSRMELAKESINKFASSLPKEANISLRVYGHKGTGSDNDKKLSCSSNELVYPMQPYNQGGLAQALSKFKPAGWTPLAQAIKEAQKDLSRYKGENNKNIIYVVSDGIETCGGDPVASAKSLKDSGIAPVVNIIGFDVAGKDQQQLEEVAKAAEGTYVNVNNQEQLQNEFTKTVEESAKWLNWKNEQDIDVIYNSNIQMMDIYAVTDGWHMKNNLEKPMILFSLNELQNKGKITNAQNNKIIDMVEAFYMEQMNSIEELEKVLVDATQEDLNATLDKIDKIYQENVSQN